MEIYDKHYLSNLMNPKIDNQYLDAHFWNVLHMICINRFKWRNLPNKISADFIERELARVGELAFVNHKQLGFCITHVSPYDINIYDEATTYICYTNNNEVFDEYKAEDIVLIKNNILSQPSYDFINRYADILGNIEKTKQINLNGLKTPIHITANEMDLTTLREIYRQYKGDEPVIVTMKQFDTESFKVFKTDVPYLLDKLQEEKNVNLSEALNFIGISTIQDKKERMVTDEVNAKNQFTDICLSMFLDPRKEAIQKINDKFRGTKDFVGNEFTEIELHLAEYVKFEVDNYPKDKEENVNE